MQIGDILVSFVKTVGNKQYVKHSGGSNYVKNIEPTPTPTPTSTIPTPTLTPTPPPTYFVQALYDQTHALLLLKFDGSFADSSTNGLAVTPQGGAQLDTSRYKFGSGSAFFDGGGDELVVNGGLSFTGDYTIEFWFRVSDAESYWGLVSFDLGDGVGMHIHTYFDGQLYANNSSCAMISGGAILPNTWHHVAFVRYNGTTTLYQDGSVIGQTNDEIGQGNGTLHIGYIPAEGSYLSGNIDEFRIMPKAVYTGPFAPPSDPLSSSV